MSLVAPAASAACWSRSSSSPGSSPASRRRSPRPRNGRRRAPSGSRAAGHTVDGLFLDAWRGHGPLLGLPITEEQPAEVRLDGLPTAERTVQYFENVALVYVPEDERGGAWQVQTLPLGEAALERDREQLRRVDFDAEGSCAGLADADCRVFPETEHSLRLGFKTFWETHDGERLLGAPLTEEVSGPEGWTVQYFERAVLQWKESTGVKPRSIGIEAARRAKIATEEIAQPLGIPVYDEALFVPPVVEVVESAGGGVGGPGPIQGGCKEIVVSVSQQYLWAYEEGQIVTETYVSTGTGNVPETVTPVGNFSVLTKYETETMEGTISEEYYRVEDVPYVMYFDNSGNALHGTYWHSNFGTPMSHGCINLPLDVAAFLYAWAPEGTAVTVID